MVLTRLEIPDLKAEYDDACFDMMDHKAVDSHGLGYPPSSSQSFSSASSSFGPFTPTSGRSTPPNSESIDFATESFASSMEPFSFDLTPPSSAVSSYFQAEVKYEDSGSLYQPRLPVTPSRGPLDFDVLPPSLYQPRLPITPSRSQLEFDGLPFSSYSQQTSPQATSYYPLGTNLAPSPLPPTPAQALPFDPSWDAWPAWSQADSPITFERKEEHSTPSFPTPLHHGRRLFAEPAKEKTTALRKVQRRGSPPRTGGIRKRTKPSNPPTKALSNGVEVPIAEGNKVKCEWGGCQLVFKKKEHMVRHRNANHLMMIFACPFCPHQSNRSDNLRDHVELHAQLRDSGKVKFVPEAAAWLAEEMRKVSRRPAKSRPAKATTKAAALKAMLDDDDPDC